MWIANELISRYNEPRIKNLVDRVDWYIVPVLNPDGYVYTWTADRLWRKTRSPNQGSTCVGTDPNRNWDFQWATGGSSSNPCTETFHGRSAFSEREMQTFSAFGNAIPNLRVYIDYHAFSQLYMRPWGYTTAAPADESSMAAMGNACASAISNRHRMTYRSGRIAVIIYVASGSSADWFYGRKRVFGFAIELRPASGGTNGFILPPAQIIPTGQENMEGVIVQGEMVLRAWDEEQKKVQTK